MPVFTFTGTDAPGKKNFRGTSIGRQQIGCHYATAPGTKYNPGAIKEKGKEFALPKLGTGKVPTKDLAVFFRQFSVMIDAGLPLVQCLEILAANQENLFFSEMPDRRADYGGRRLNPFERHAPIPKDF